MRITLTMHDLPTSRDVQQGGLPGTTLSDGKVQSQRASAIWCHLAARKDILRTFQQPMFLCHRILLMLVLAFAEIAFA